MSNRRLDALFAEKVLGLPVQWCQEGQGYLFPGPYSHFIHTDDYYIKCAPDSGNLMRDKEVDRVVPIYTRSLDAIWAAAAPKFTGNHTGFAIWRADGQWHGGLGEWDDIYFAGEAEHPAEALVLALLRAIGVSEEEINGAR